MSRSRLLCSLVVLTTAATLPAGDARAQQGPAEGPYVETVGVGERRIAPDRATVNVQVITRAASAAEAAGQNARAADAVRDTLRKMGLESAMATASYFVGPDYDVPRPREATDDARPVRYLARTLIRVDVTRLASLGQVIDASLARGATGVEGVFFQSSRAELARREALADAARAAKADAEAVAAAMGGSLGAMISSSTAAGNDPRRGNFMMAPGVAGGRVTTEVTPNEIVVSAGIVARWRFEPR